MRETRFFDLRHLIIFQMLGCLIFLSDLLMEFLPNIHLVGVLIIVYTIVYRRRALIPLYIYVFLYGLVYGFSLWWIPYLYIWTLLWGGVMLLPKNMPTKVALPVYMAVGGLHGILFGVLYAPFQALAFGLSFEKTLLWIASGFPFDVIHCVGNVVLGVLILPLVGTLRRLEGRFSHGCR